MALVEVYHVVASSRTVDTTGADIKEGMLVSLNSDGEVIKETNSSPFVYGIAGDTKADDASSMPGVDAGWQNRVSDYFDETKASGKMTVYNGGGEFYTDQYDAGAGAAAIGVPLYAVEGLFSTATTDSSIIIAHVVNAAGQIQSGVPGTDIDGDIALGSEQTNNTYIGIKLLV